MRTEAEDELLSELTKPLRAFESVVFCSLVKLLNAFSEVVRTALSSPVESKVSSEEEICD